MEVWLACPVHFMITSVGMPRYRAMVMKVRRPQCEVRSSCFGCVFSCRVLPMK